jgi:hypothetical protein
MTSQSIYTGSQQTLTWIRLVICVGRRRLSAMAKCRLVRIALTIRRNVYLHKLRRRGTHPKGMEDYENTMVSVANAYLVQSISRASKIV